MFKWFFLFLIPFYFSCSSENKNVINGTTENKSDTLEIIRGFIYGLWSKDTGNTLNNEGYYFKPDGSVDFVAGEETANWEMVNKDSLKIIYPSYNEALTSIFKIDSITEGRMILRSKEGSHLFRKVPFGMNNEGVVQQGFAGKLETGDEKEYSINIPPAKKMELKLRCENKNVVFNIYDSNILITPTPVQNWTAIMIRGGAYKVMVFNKSAKASKEGDDFDLKVIGY